MGNVTKEFTHLGREGNQFTDALATLVFMARIDFGHKVQPVHIDIRNNPAHCCSVKREVDGNPWYYDIKNFIQTNSLHTIQLRQRITNSLQKHNSAANTNLL
jgi:hypothetical protein